MNENKEDMQVVEDYEDQFLDFTDEMGVNCTILGHVTKGKMHIDGEHFGFINEAKNTYDTSLEKRIASI